MELTPSQVTSATFKTVRKGYDPDEVSGFLQRVSRALEEAQQQATAMEARARAAVARLQELTAAAEAAPAVAEAAPLPAPGAGEPPTVHVAADDAETITRTLLLAQRSADAAVADAKAEADRILAEARAEAESTLDSTREMSAKLLDDARTEARKASEDERVAAEGEVQSLVGRRQVLVTDVDRLEQFLIDQRERLRGAARQIEALVERVPAGLGHVRPPTLGSSGEPTSDDTSELVRPAPEALAQALDEVSPANGIVRPPANR
jgi:DivIVA domain-containing protein